MRPANLFQMELADALTARRALVMRLGTALLLGLPLALAGMPVRVRAAGMAMLVLFIALFGSAVGLARRREDGRLERVALLPVPRWLGALDLLLAGSAVDLLQLAPPLALLLAVNAPAPSPTGVLTVAGLLAGAVLALNALGMLLARAARSNAEVHLLAALAGGATALLSGLVPVPATLGALVQAVSNAGVLGRLARRLEALLTGGPAPGAPELVAAAVVLATMAAAVALRGQGATGACPPDTTQGTVRTPLARVGFTGTSRPQPAGKDQTP